MPEDQNPGTPEGRSESTGGPRQPRHSQPRKPKVRIGPKNRRANDPPSAAPAAPAAGNRNESRSGQGGGTPRKHFQQVASSQDAANGGIRRKRRRRKGGGRKPEGEPSAAPSPEEGLEPTVLSAPTVLPPVQEDLDEIPSGIFKTIDPSELGIEVGSDVDDSQADAPSDAPRPVQAGRNDRRKRKKRKEKFEPPPVDRSKGFWWSEQWIRSFEMLFPSNASRSRLAKGRTYARRGQVMELEVGPNGVLARVQGSRPRPYQVRLELNRLRRETWGRIIHLVAGKAEFLARLLEGVLPPEIEEVFFASGARLFPHGDNDVRFRCNCPDPVVPCKHAAALNYALAEALLRDPFLLFALRGKSRDQFLQDLREKRGRDSGERDSAQPEDLAEFWRMGRLAESVLRPLSWNTSSDPARLLQSLGEPQLEGIREGSFLSLMESTYRQVSEAMRRLPKDY
ncbi:MAG TPA: hypothetical protein PKO15_11925 [Fibrobacteria bacterium]|nr:hypothetical protein [Fibrobacteria bacterium]HOX51611.1 hypothetical protein [Fibrobacteria bacterium]